MKGEVLKAGLILSLAVSCGGRPPGVVQGVETTPTPSSVPSATRGKFVLEGRTEQCSKEDENGNIVDGLMFYTKLPDGKWVANPDYCIFFPTPQPTPK